MSWFLFTIFFAACLGAGVTGGIFPPGAWYRALNKPSWTPPDWLFPVAWFLLYICMALAATRAAQKPDSGVAMAFWSLQIALNALWTPVFFGLKNIRQGMWVVLALWFSVLCGTIALWQVDWFAGLLFVPYLAWVTVAASLNAAVWRLNPEEARGPR